MSQTSEIRNLRQRLDSLEKNLAFVEATAQSIVREAQTSMSSFREEEPHYTDLDNVAGWAGSVADRIRKLREGLTAFLHGRDRAGII